ncbi:AAA family ATPase [Nocardia vaccinii]|uniref:AAA family ATPase n=1 Tax=Nocardia vaccinii TaxID=1822 RepID=UPI0009FCC6DA|nr:AAA family ATPase [Nocardia vaccinii]
MPELLVMVNGLPGSGKSTLGRALARELGARFLSKDAVKEALAASVDGAGALSALGGIAMDTVWALAPAMSNDVVIDSWWFAPRDRASARSGLAAAGAARAVEIWCDVPAEIARVRYESRDRPGLYRDREHLVRDWDAWAAQAEPLGLAAATISVDTSGPVDCALLAERVRSSVCY